MTIMTIGHSTLKEGEFAHLLGQHKIHELWDTRSHPGSTNHPQFNRGVIEQWLPVRYEWVPQLGGWNASHAGLAKDMEVHGVDVLCYCHRHFPKQRIAAERPHAEGEVTWWNQGLYDYSWFTSLPEFMYTAKELAKDARTKNIAVMCSEAQWWRCHRSMIADYLASIGHEAMHVMGNRQQSHYKVMGNRLDRYDPRIRAAWENGNGRKNR